MNQTFFKRILIGEESEILGVTLTPAYAAVAEWHEPFGQPQAPEASQGAEDGPLAVVSAQKASSGGDGRKEFEPRRRSWSRRRSRSP
jgi:hypothetical protein